MHSSRLHSPAFVVATVTPALLLVVALGSCEKAPTAVEERSETRKIAPTDKASFGALSGRLPSTDTVTSSVPAFEIKQKGGGIAGRFEITNANSAAIALDGVNSGSGHALLAWNLGKGRGAVIITSNSANTLPTLDVSGQSSGSAADIRANNSASTNPAVNI